MSRGSKNYYLDLHQPFLENINRKVEANNYEEINNIRKNKELLPSFKYYYDNTDLGSSIIPPHIYKNKNIFNELPPIQTEHDEIGINKSFLDKYYDYTEYTNFFIQNQSMPEKNKHKITPKEFLFELV